MSDESFGCCGVDMGDSKAEWPCRFFMRRHPFITAGMVAVMGLAALVIPVGAVLGIIAFLRTI